MNQDEIYMHWHVDVARQIRMYAQVFIYISYLTFFLSSQLWLNGFVILTDYDRNHLETMSF